MGGQCVEGCAGQGAQGWAIDGMHGSGYGLVVDVYVKYVQVVGCVPEGDIGGRVE